MARNPYYPSALKLPYDDMIKLMRDEKLEIVVEKYLVAKLYVKTDPIIQKLNESIKFWSSMCWTILIISTLIIAYFYSWLWVIAGIFVGFLLVNTDSRNKKEIERSMHQYILTSILKNKDFYEKFIEDNAEGWYYEINEEQAKPYFQGEQK